MGIQKSIWEKFVAKEELDEKMLPSKIAESWEYCRSEAVNPYIRKGTAILQLADLQKVTTENKMLIDFVKREINAYQPMLKMSRPIFILTDREGTILWREGNHEAKNYANEITFKEGSIWTEKEVGTNAIGIAIRTGEPVTVHNYEHYSVASHKFSCTSSPIYNENNELIGCIDVSSLDGTEFDQYTLMTMQVISKNVQERFIRRSLSIQKAIIEYAFAGEKVGVMCDASDRIIKISDELNVNEAKWLGKNKRELSKSVDIGSVSEAIYFENEIVGYFYPYLEEKKGQVPGGFYYFGIRSENDAYKKMMMQVRQAANSHLPIHIYGESGSGKEIVAKTIHYNSPYDKGPLISINCGALSENLLESELFGYGKGAFTGANEKGYKGKIEQAQNGTLFLDEIDSMSSRMQSALLRVLEEKKVVRIGSEEQIEVNFRIITASNQDLRRLVEKKQFRLDLFYRLYVAPVFIPPLRKRTEDMEIFVEEYCKKKEWYPLWRERISEIAREFHWYGNIRELNNFLDRLYLYYPKEEPTDDEIRETVNVGALFLDENVAEQQVSKEHGEILKALENNHFNISDTAIELNVARSTLYRKIKKYNIETE